MTRTAFTGAVVWTGVEGESAAPATVLVEGDRISAVGPPAQVTVPGDAVVVDARGCTLLPGLIDTHVHLATNSDLAVVPDNSGFLSDTPRAEMAFHSYRNATRALRAGFTSLRVMGHRGAGEVELRDMIGRGLLVGPRLAVAPWWVTMTAGHGDMFHHRSRVRREWDTVDGPDACRALVRLQVREGADFIKVMASGGVMSHGDDPRAPNFTVAELEAVVDEAHALGLTVAAHAHSTEGVRRCLEAGVDSIEHGSFVDEVQLQRIVDSQTFLVPTLSIMDWSADPDVERGAGEGGAAAVRAVIDEQRENFARAVRQGARIAMGTDSSGNLCPFGEHARELELYVQMGMSADAALRTATTVAAELLGWSDRVGSVEPGKLADLVLVDGDLLQDITLLRSHRPRAVFVGGQDVTAELDAGLHRFALAH